MGSSLAPSPVYFSSKIRFLCHHKFKFSSNPVLIRPKNPRIFSLPASIAQKDHQLSWCSSDQNGTDEFNGWAVFEPPVKMGKKEKGSISWIRKFLIYIYNLFAFGPLVVFVLISVEEIMIIVKSMPHFFCVVLWLLDILFLESFCFENIVSVRLGFCSKNIGGDWCCGFDCLNWSYCIHFTIKERSAVPD